MTIFQVYFLKPSYCTRETLCGLYCIVRCATSWSVCRRKAFWNCARRRRAPRRPNWVSATASRSTILTRAASLTFITITMTMIMMMMMMTMRGERWKIVSSSGWAMEPTWRTHNTSVRWRYDCLCSIMLLTMTRSPVVARVGRPYRLRLISDGQWPTSGCGKKMISPSEYSPIYAMVTLLYRTLQLTPGYDTVIRRTRVNVCRQQLCIQNCRQTAADRHD